MSIETVSNSPHETGLDVLQLGLSEQGFGDVEIPSLDEGSVAEHRGRLTGAMAAIAVGSLALAAPAAVSAEQTNAITGVQNTTQTTFEMNSDGVSRPIMTALKYRKLNSQCGIAALKISSPAKEPSILNTDIYMNHIILGRISEKIKRTHRNFARIPHNGVILPVKVCKNEEQGILNGVFTADNMHSGSFTFNWNAKSHRWEKEYVDVVR